MIILANVDQCSKFFPQLFCEKNPTCTHHDNFYVTCNMFLQSLPYEIRMSKKCYRIFTQNVTINNFKQKNYRKIAFHVSKTYHTNDFTSVCAQDLVIVINKTVCQCTKHAQQFSFCTAAESSFRYLLQQYCSC